MEYITKKLKAMKDGQQWDYGNGFTVMRLGTKWAIFKNGFLDVESTDIQEVGRQIKLTFIAIEVEKKVLGEMLND